MATKKELLQQQVAKAVGAGKAVALETVDFNDPNRPKTCLEVDFPHTASQSNCSCGVVFWCRHKADLSNGQVVGAKAI